jgi:formylglycine-generating enzyme required for sulfatase activity
MNRQEQHPSRRVIGYMLVVAMVMTAVVFAQRRMQAQTALDSAVPAVVRIVAINCNIGCIPQAVGSGAIIHPGGLILTALHVVVEDKNNPLSPTHTDFLIETTARARDPVQTRYRARVAALAPDVDLALLQIYFDEERRIAFDANADLALPTLPIGDNNRVSLGTALQILGYPLVAGNTIDYTTTQVGGFEERMIRVRQTLSPGNSGGPALAEQDGRLAIVAVVSRNRGVAGEVALLREVASLDRLIWLPDARQGWLADLAIEASAEQLTVQSVVHTVGVTGDSVRLLAYLFDARTGAPWQNGAESGANLIRTRSGQVVLAQHVPVDKFITGNIVNLSIDLSQLNATPADLRVHLVLWDGKAGRALWQSERPVGVSQLVAIASTATSTPIPPETNTPTRSPTSTNTAAPADTPTDAPTFTATPTATPVPPTATATSTPTPTEPEAGATRVVEGITFVYVPAGEFTMGSNQSSEEQPIHEVYLDGYWIGQTEVTNVQFRAFIEAGGYSTEAYWREEEWTWRLENQITEPANWQDSLFNGDQQPVNAISWYEADAYSRWLAQKSGLPIRLPTEAEWEKAARGTDGRIYPWGSDWDPSRANYCDKRCGDAFDWATWADGNNDDGYARTSPVGSFPNGASPYGALDMAGNVWEWTGDWYGSDYYATSPERNPGGPDSGSFRVLRGGSWSNYPTNLRGADRGWSNPGGRKHDVGMRVVVAPGF